MPQNSNTARNLERKGGRFISLTLKDIRNEGKRGVWDRNFEREASSTSIGARKGNARRKPRAVDAYRGPLPRGESQVGDYGARRGFQQ